MVLLIFIFVLALTGGVQSDCEIGQHTADPTDCRLFHHCAVSSAPKSCGFMMFNPVRQVCDWPTNVMQIRPECRDEEELKFDQHTDLSRSRTVSRQKALRMLRLLRAPSSSRLNSINKPLREEDGQYRQTYSTAIKRNKEHAEETKFKAKSPELTLSSTDAVIRVGSEGLNLSSLSNLLSERIQNQVKTRLDSLKENQLQDIVPESQVDSAPFFVTPKTPVLAQDSLLHPSTPNPVFSSFPQSTGVPQGSDQALSNFPLSGQTDITSSQPRSTLQFVPVQQVLPTPSFTPVTFPLPSYDAQWNGISRGNHLFGPTPSPFSTLPKGQKLINGFRVPLQGRFDTSSEGERISSNNIKESEISEKLDQFKEETREMKFDGEEKPLKRIAFSRKIRINPNRFNKNNSSSIGRPRVLRRRLLKNDRNIILEYRNQLSREADKERNSMEFGEDFPNQIAPFPYNAIADLMPIDEVSTTTQRTRAGLGGVTLAASLRNTFYPVEERSELSFESEARPGDVPLSPWPYGNSGFWSQQAPLTNSQLKLTSDTRSSSGFRSRSGFGSSSGVESSSGYGSSFDPENSSGIEQEISQEEYSSQFWRQNPDGRFKVERNKENPDKTSAEQVYLEYSTINRDDDARENKFNAANAQNEEDKDDRENKLNAVNAQNAQGKDDESLLKRIPTVKDFDRSVSSTIQEVSVSSSVNEAL